MLATVRVDNYSFPSGHTTRATLMALMFVATAVTSTAAVVALLGWAVATGVSRVTLGRHHVLDVVCGWGFGALLFALLQAALTL
jgi:membrane-associated phospholipid phosphatase